MNARTLVLCSIILVLIALLFRQCNRAINPCPDAATILLPGKTDTVVVHDTIDFRKQTKKPMPIDVHPGLPVGYVTPELDHRNACDSIRVYNDSLVSSDGVARVNSIVAGELLSQEIKMTAFGQNKIFTRVDTLKITREIKFGFSVVAAVDLNNGPGVGARVELNRISFDYQYFPINKSNQFLIGYSLFRR